MVFVHRPQVDGPSTNGNGGEGKSENAPHWAQSPTAMLVNSIVTGCMVLFIAYQSNAIRTHGEDIRAHAQRFEDHEKLFARYEATANAQSEILSRLTALETRAGTAEKRAEDARLDRVEAAAQLSTLSHVINERIDEEIKALANQINELKAVGH